MLGQRTRLRGRDDDPVSGVDEGRLHGLQAGREESYLSGEVGHVLLESAHDARPSPVAQVEAESALRWLSHFVPGEWRKEIIMRE